MNPDFTELPPTLTPLQLETRESGDTVIHDVVM